VTAYGNWGNVSLLLQVNFIRSRRRHDLIEIAQAKPGKLKFTVYIVDAPFKLRPLPNSTTYWIAYEPQHDHSSQGKRFHLHHCSSRRL
jgi:hypothetical protein